MKILCQSCGKIIAVADTAILAYPLTGDMFKGIGKAKSPFGPEETWESLRCPACSARPFLQAHVVFTPTGPITVPLEAEDEPVIAPKAAVKKQAVKVAKPPVPKPKVKVPKVEKPKAPSTKVIKKGKK